MKILGLISINLFKEKAPIAFLRNIVFNYQQVLKLPAFPLFSAGFFCQLL